MPTPEPRYRRQTAEARRQSLIDAAIQCLQQGGIAAFTVDRISREAGASRGLINHHFAGIDDLLDHCYRQMTAGMQRTGQSLQDEAADPEAQLVAVIDVLLTPPIFTRAPLRAWLALWGEVGKRPALHASHRKAYESYRSAIATQLARIAEVRGITVQSEALAATLIALMDGLWIEYCLDGTLMTPEAARASVFGVIEAQIGPIQR